MTSAPDEPFLRTAAAVGVGVAVGRAVVATLPGGVVTTVTMPLDVITPGCVVGVAVFVPKLKTDSTVGVGEGVGVAVRGGAETATVL